MVNVPQALIRTIKQVKLVTSHCNEELEVRRAYDRYLLSDQQFSRNQSLTRLRVRGQEYVWMTELEEITCREPSTQDREGGLSLFAWCVLIGSCIHRLPQL